MDINLNYNHFDDNNLESNDLGQFDSRFDDDRLGNNKDSKIHSKKINYHQLVDIFGSKLKADEIVYLLNNNKEVVRQLFFNDELQKVKNFCMLNTLNCVVSNFKIVFLDNSGDSTFSNKGERVELSDPREGARVCYISSDEKPAYQAALAEQQRDDKILGELLGYPNCCIDFFLNNFSSSNTNPELRMVEVGENDKNLVDDSKKIKIDLRLLNIKKRPEDICLLSHFPCTWDCGASFNIAENRLLLMHSIDKKRAEELEKGLEQA